MRRTSMLSKKLMQVCSPNQTSYNLQILIKTFRLILVIDKSGQTVFAEIQGYVSKKN